MKRLKEQKNRIGKIRTLFFVLGFFICIGITTGMVQVAGAAWEEPSAQAPAGNIYAPLTIGPEYQAKKGSLILDPLYNPYGATPATDYPLDVRGTRDVYINTFTLANPGNLTVDTDTLYVSGTNHRVGMGTTTPHSSVLLDVEGGSANAGTSTTPISTGPGISVNTSGAGSTAASGYADGSQPAVSGSSIAGPGVYGLNQGSGVGLYAYSKDASAVVGVLNAPFNPSSIIAAVYGEATGIGAWAGYFQQRLYTSEALVAGKFVPNRLQQSQVPYTAGWEVRQAVDSLHIQPNVLVFDGQYVWAIAGTPYGQEQAYVLDPVDGRLITSFYLRDAGGNIAHEVQNGIFAGGYIWLANTYSGGRGVTRIDPVTYIVTHFNIGAAGAYDLAYDDKTAGGPYIWAVTRNTSTYAYAVVRLKPTDGTVQPYSYSGYDCPSYYQTTYPATPATSGVNNLELGWPSGISFDEVNTLWISFRGVVSSTRFQGAGMAQITTTDPQNTFVKHCIGDTRFPSDIAVGGGYVWIGQEPPWYAPQTHDGFTRYTINGGVTQEFSAGYPVTHVKFDGLSSSGPLVWLGNYDYIFSYDMNGAVVHAYEQPAGSGSFDFDRTSGATAYVWAVSSADGFVTRNMIYSPYTTDTFLIKGALPNDMAFDGTYLWVTNEYGDSISQYRAADGSKVGEVRVGWYPEEIVFDGKYLWVTYNARGGDATDLARIDVVTKAVSNYNFTSSQYTFDMVFDGTFLWVTNDNDNTLYRIDRNACAAGSCPTNSYALADNPTNLAYDGQNIWVTHRGNATYGYNAFSKINPATGARIATYNLPSDSSYNKSDDLMSIIFDGTYVWLGTRYIDTNGNSIFRINPTDGSIAGRSGIYTEPGTCSGGTRNGLYCTNNAACTGGGACSATQSNVRALTFDGTQIWALQEMGTPTTRECGDRQDNDGDTLIDRGICSNVSYSTQATCQTNGGTWTAEDPDCESVSDLHESAGTAPECNDGLDNDGNGRCDFDGGVGHPGCSGHPDPGCSSALDVGEKSPTRETHLSRLLAATGQFIESITYGNYCDGPAELAFDGGSVWFADSCGSVILHQFYSGAGLGLPSQSGLVRLDGAMPSTGQTGNFSLSGNATIGARLTVMGDLVVSANVWGGVDTAKAFGAGCDAGQYVKGIDLTGNTITCRQL